MVKLLPLLAFCVLSCNGATYYASSTATAGSGTLNDPYGLQIALTNHPNIPSGSTLTLLDGTFQGPGFYCNLTNVLIRRQSFDGAVLNDAKGIGVLLTNLTASTNDRVAVKIANSENWREQQVVTFPNGESCQLQTKNGTNWTIVRQWSVEGTAVQLLAHASNDVCRLYAPILYCAGQSNVFFGLLFSGLMTTNRELGTPYITNSCPSGLDLHGTNNSAFNCRGFNVGHPGIGYWSQGTGSQVNGCIISGVGMYHYGGIPVSGNAVYSQNQNGMATIKNCINIANFTGGGKVFGETGPVKDFQFLTNFILRCSAALEIASGSTSTSNTYMLGNRIQGTPTLSYVSLSNRAQYFIGNTIINGSFTIKETTDFSAASNIVFMPTNSGSLGAPIIYQQTANNRSALGAFWDYNTYYIGAGSSPYQFNFSSLDYSNTFNALGGGNLRFNLDNTNSWKDWSLFDSNSVYGTNWPVGYLDVLAVRTDFDPNEWHIGVVAIVSSNTVNLNLAAIGFNNGDVYRLRDAQNYFTPIASGVYNGTPLALPLNLTSVHTINGTLTHMTNEHTNVRWPGLFNAFVLERTGVTLASGAFTLSGGATLQ